jgi:hypothetical protein
MSISLEFLHPSSLKSQLEETSKSAQNRAASSFGDISHLSHNATTLPRS